MALRLHWSPDSANLVPRIALERLGLDYAAVRVDRTARAHRTPEYLALNPQGLIPVLEDDSEDGPLVLFETGAILVHLADRTGRLGGDGAPKGPAARAAFLRWVFFLSNTLHADLRVAFRPHRYLATEAVPALREGLSGRVAAHLDLLERAVAETGALAGPAPTFADDYLAVCIRWAQLYPSAEPLLPGALDGRPALAALLRGIEASPAIRRACAAESIPGDRPFTAPRPPDLPPEQVTG